MLYHFLFLRATFVVPSFQAQMSKLQIFSSLAAPIEVESDEEMEKVATPTKTPEPKHTKELDQCLSTTKRRLSFSRIAAKVRQFTLDNDVPLYQKQWPVWKQVGGRCLMRAIRQESDSEPEGQDPLSPVERQEISQLVEDQDPALSETGRPEISEDEGAEFSETERPGISELVLKFFPPRAQCPEVSQSAEDEAGELSEAQWDETPQLAEDVCPDLPEMECPELCPPEGQEIHEPELAEMECPELSPSEGQEIREPELAEMERPEVSPREGQEIHEPELPEMECPELSPREGQEIHEPELAENGRPEVPPVFEALN